MSLAKKYPQNMTKSGGKESTDRPKARQYWVGATGSRGSLREAYSWMPQHCEGCGVHWCLLADATPLPSLHRLTLMVGPTPHKSRAIFHALLKRVLNLHSFLLIFYSCRCSFPERALDSAHLSLRLQRELMLVWQQRHPFHKLGWPLKSMHSGQSRQL